MQTILFLLAAGIAGFGALASNLLSPRPRGWVAHVRALARLGVFAACTSYSARILHDGMAPSIESVVLAWSLAALYLLQVRCEVQRQESGRV